MSDFNLSQAESPRALYSCSFKRFLQRFWVNNFFLLLTIWSFVLSNKALRQTVSLSGQRKQQKHVKWFVHSYLAAIFGCTGLTPIRLKLCGTYHFRNVRELVTSSVWGWQILLDQCSIQLSLTRNQNKITRHTNQIQPSLLLNVDVYSHRFSQLLRLLHEFFPFVLSWWWRCNLSCVVLFFQ